MLRKSTVLKRVFFEIAAIKVIKIKNAGFIEILQKGAAMANPNFN